MTTAGSAAVLGMHVACSWCEPVLREPFLRQDFIAEFVVCRVLIAGGEKIRKRDAYVLLVRKQARVL